MGKILANAIYLSGNNGSSKNADEVVFKIKTSND